MDLASERLEVGLVTRTDLFDAKARFKQAEANQIQAQNNINNDLALLKQIIGVTPEQLLPLSESAPLELPRPNDVESWVNRSLSNNIMLAITISGTGKLHRVTSNSKRAPCFPLSVWMGAIPGRIPVATPTPLPAVPIPPESP